MSDKWVVGGPGGPSGSFWSVVSSSGMVIAVQIPSEEIAKRIAKLPELEEHLDKLEKAMDEFGIIIDFF